MEILFLSYVKETWVSWVKPFLHLPVQLWDNLWKSEMVYKQFVYSTVLICFCCVKSLSFDTWSSFLRDISNAWYSINTFRDLSHAYHSTPTFPHCTRSHTCNRIKHNTLEVIVTESCSFWPPWSKMKPWCIPCPCTRNSFFVYDPCIHLLVFIYFKNVLIDR